MMRTTLTHILIATVAFCPYFCLAELVQGSCERETVCSCSESEDGSGDKAPGPFDTEEPDCFCRGAIVDGTRVECQETRMDDLPLLWLSDATTDCCVLSVADDSQSCHYPPHSTGREICSLISVQLL